METGVSVSQLAGGGREGDKAQMPRRFMGNSRDRRLTGGAPHVYMPAPCPQAPAGGMLFGRKAP